MAVGEIIYQNVHIEIEGKYQQVWRIKTDEKGEIFITSSRGYDSRGSYEIKSIGKALAEVNKLIRNTDNPRKP